VNQTESSAKKKVVIIGAGPAGLTAGYELCKCGRFDVVLLEASEKIGGISQTVFYHGNRMDIGGHRFFSKNDAVMDWWLSLLPLQGYPAWDDRQLGRHLELAPGGPDPEKEDLVMLNRRRVSRIFYLHRFFDYPISLKWATLRSLGFGRTTRAGFSYLWSAMLKKPEDSLENFYINRFGKVLYRLFFEHYTEKVWGLHPARISASWGAQRVKGLSVRAILRDMMRKAAGRKDASTVSGQKQIETSLIEQFLYPKHGPGQLWEHVAQRITGMGGDIRLGCPVCGLEARAGALCSVRYADAAKGGAKSEGCPGEALSEIALPADFVLSSMPLRDLVAGLRGVETPPDIRMIAAGLPYRDFITVGLLVDRLAIQNQTGIPAWNKLVPDCWIYIQEPGVRIGRLQIFNNWSPYMVADPENTVWLGLEYFCQEGDALWEMDDAAFCSLAAEELVKIGLIERSAVRDACRIKIKKAYPAYFGTYGQIGQLIGYLDSFDNLFCIGRNGQHRYNNMDHSMLSAMLAVGQIVSGQVDKAAIWQVNAEQEYQEQKNAPSGESAARKHR
jgi:protoporphyrinogen oxidase